jgi:hypothetical protein
MKLREVIAIIAWTAATSWGWGQTSETPSQVNWALPLLQSGVTSYQFSVEIPAPRSLEIPEGRIYSVPGQVASPPGGYPDVPLLARTIPGMAAYTPVVAEATSVYIDIRDVEMAPAENVTYQSANDGETVRHASRSRLAAIYEQAGFWPDALVGIQTAMMGTQPYIRIEARPVQYDPIERKARIHSVIRGQLNLVPRE